MSSRWDDSKKSKRKERPDSDHNEPQRKRRRREEMAVDHTSEEQWGKPEKQKKEEEEEKEPEAPNFGLSGLLANEANKDETTGVVLKYKEPKNARKPTKKWRLHVFKNEESLPVIALHKDSFHLFGRDRKVVHIATDHPSCSSQHAVLQFRSVPLLDDVGLETGSMIIKPYLMDLESTNGTLLNDKKIKPARYYELVLGDCIKFGFSSREYVLLYEEAVN